MEGACGGQRRRQQKSPPNGDVPEETPQEAALNQPPSRGAD